MRSRLLEWGSIRQSCNVNAAAWADPAECRYDPAVTALLFTLKLSEVTVVPGGHLTDSHVPRHDRHSGAVGYGHFDIENLLNVTVTPLRSRRFC